MSHEEERGDKASGEAMIGREPSPMAREVEGGDQSSGVPAAGTLSASDGSPGIRHWRESTITRPGLDERGTVFFAAVEMTRMPMALSDPNQPDNPLVFVNRAFVDLTGYEQHEIIGRNCRFLQGPATDRESVRAIREAVEGHHAIAIELINYKRDGTPFWNGVFIGPVFDPDGRLLYFFASQLDVTRRHTSEQAFRQAQKMEAIGQLTAGLAHDFNNILQVVSGNIEMVLERTGEARLRRALENAGRAADRGASLTRQLLAFARKTRLDPRPTDLNRLIVGVGDLIDNTVGRHVELRYELTARLPLAQIDTTHLEMALINVLINARDAMPAGGTVTIATASRAAPADGSDRPMVVLSVADTGEGMPPHVVERATEPFFTTKPTDKGTGLGLAMVHGFVQQSGGRLEIDSAPGQGTTVRLLLPGAAAPSHAQDTPKAAGAPEPEPAGARGSQETILVVEDSEDVLALAQDYLGHLGYRTLAARNADEALAILGERGREVALLFTDILMPGSLNGLGLAEAAARDWPDLPVLFATGYNEELVTETARPSGMDVLGKPYRRSELADRVKAALARAGQTPAVGPSGREAHLHEA